MKSKITTRFLTWFLLVSLTPLIFLAYVSYLNAEKTVKTEVINNLNTIADRDSHHIDDYIAKKKRDVDVLAQNPVVRDAIEKFNSAYMEKGVGSAEYSAINNIFRPYFTSYQDKKEYNDLFLVSRDGEVVFSVKKKADLATQLISEPELADIVMRATALSETYISDFKNYQSSDEPAAFIAAPVRKEGELIGVVALQISTEKLYEAVHSYSGLGETGEIVLAAKENDKAIFVAPLRHDPDAAFNRKVTIGSKDAFPIQEAIQGREGFGFSIDYRGREILAAWRYLPELRWGMVVKIDTEEAFGPITSLRNWMLLIGGITAMVVIFIAILAARSISRPIHKLQQGAEKIGEGDLNYKIGISDADEIGSLSRSFDSTVEVLKKEITDRKNAEDKLKSHTRVLSAINEIFRERINCKTEEDLGKKCLEVAEKLTGSKFGFFGELNSKGYFDCIAISNPGWDACNIPEGQSRLIIKDMPLTGIDRATMIDGVPRIVNGAEAFSEHPDHVGIPEGHPTLTAFLGVPFIENGKVIGMIGLGNKEGGYTLDDQLNIEALSIAILETLRTKRAADEKRQAQELIIQSKQDWERTFNQITDMITIHDKDYNIVRANKAAMEILNLPYVNSEPVKCFKFYHGTESNPKGCPSCTCLNTKEPINFETFEPHLNMFLEVRAMPRFDNNNEFNGIIHVVRDITKRKQAEDRISRQLENLNALRSIDNAINSTLDLNVTLDIFLDQVVTQLHADASNVLILNQDTMTLDHAASKGFRTEDIKQTSMELGVGYAGYVALERKTVIETNMSNISDKCRRTFLLKNENFKTYFGIPLIAKGSVKGVLEVYNRSPFKPDEEWLEFFEALAGQAAIAIDNSVMFDEVQRSRDELVMAYDSTIEGWSRALDHRDKETEGHSRRVTNMTVEIARKMGFSDPELVHIRRGALLHDIGKLGVADSILFKPGELNDDEWEIMKSHTVIAHEILTPIPYLRVATQIPYCHHEKWDGTGYPQGLKGDAIPFSARIFAVVDIWDALNSDRSYRKAWPKEKIIEYIKSLSGNHLDPNVADVFLEMIAETCCG